MQSTYSILIIEILRIRKPITILIYSWRVSFKIYIVKNLNKVLFVLVHPVTK